MIYSLAVRWKNQYQEKNEMACFVVPAAEAVVTTIVKKNADKKADSKKTEIRNPFLRRMNWLNNMLWGGSALLAFEHVWHGEVVPWFPFLTNAADPISAAGMLREMATSGVAMAALVTAAWVFTVFASGMLEKRTENLSAETGGKR